MRIKKITKLKNGKYKILLNNNESIVTYDDVVIKERLLYQKEIDLEVLKDLVKETSYFDVYYKMIHLIQTRYRSFHEIEEYLEKENLKEKEKKKILDMLVSNGFIDDIRFTSCYINDRLYLSNDGPFLIYKNLLSFGIEESIVTNALQNIDPSLFYDKLVKQVEKKVKNNTKYSKYILENKIVQTFIEKGFEEKMIREVFASCFVENTDVISKEYQKLYQKLSSKYEKEKLSYQIKQKLYSKGFTREEIEDILSKNA